MDNTPKLFFEPECSGRYGHYRDHSSGSNICIYCSAIMRYTKPFEESPVVVERDK